MRKNREGERSWGDGTPLRRGISDLYVEHADNLRGWLQVRTYSGQVAEDLCAETFAVALENAHKYDPSRGDTGAWLWGIARNLLRRYHRTSAVDARARARLAIQITPVAEDDLALIDSQCDAELLRARIDAALDDLSPTVALAIRSRVLDGHSYAEVARVCGCSEGAARVRVSRGLSDLLERSNLSDIGEVTW